MNRDCSFLLIMIYQIIIFICSSFLARLEQFCTRIVPEILAIIENIKRVLPREILETFTNVFKYSFYVFFFSKLN